MTYQPTAFAVSTDGDIFIGYNNTVDNDAYVLKVTATGGTSMAFGTSSLKSYNFDATDTIGALTFRPDGQLVIAASTSTGKIAIAVVSPTTGAYTGSFHGGTFALMTPTDPTNVSYTVRAVDASNDIVVSGLQIHNTTSETAAFVARFTTNGAVDTSLSTDGYAAYQLNSSVYTAADGFVRHPFGGEYYLLGGGGNSLVVRAIWK
jgi:hypothetical protein